MSKNKFFANKPIANLKDYLGNFDYFDKEGSALSRSQQHRRNWGILLAIVFFIFIVSRLFLLQVQEGFLNYKLSEGNRIRDIPVGAPRGYITDEFGKELANNEASYELIVRANRKKDISDVSDEIFAAVGTTRANIEKLIDDNKTQNGFVVVRDKIPREEALVLKSRIPSYNKVEIISSYVRKYQDTALSHVLGYTGRLSQDELTNNPSVAINDQIGKSGLEKVYDEYLQGTPGYRRAEVNASGKLIRLLTTVEPKIGNTVQTSIDKELEDKAYEILSAKAQELGTKGALVAMDPRDGSIKAMVSYPGYDNNKLSSGMTQQEYDAIANDPTKPLLNRASAGSYPSGSTIKPFYATAALANGVVSESTAFDTPPFIEIGQWKFPDWKDHGLTDIRRAIAESNNIFFYAIGGGYGPIKNGLGPDGMKKGLERFGFGKSTGIDLTAEASGFIPTPEWKKKTTGENWFIGNTYNMAIGQGDLMVTPLQIANGTSAIANGGTLFSPRIAKKILTPSGQLIREFTKDDNTVAKDIYPSDPLRIVREGMRQTVTSGSAFSLFGSNFPLEVAAKTGTAQFGNEGKTHAWFTSFAPYDNPKLVVTVIIEGGGEGYQTAGPIAKDLFSWWNDNRAQNP